MATSETWVNKVPLSFVSKRCELGWTRWNPTQHPFPLLLITCILGGGGLGAFDLHEGTCCWALSSHTKHTAFRTDSTSSGISQPSQYQQQRLEKHKGKVTYSKGDKKRIIFGCKCMLYTGRRKRKLLGKALEGWDKWEGVRKKSASKNEGRPITCHEGARLVGKDIIVLFL
jgi:hypothetical protein